MQLISDELDEIKLRLDTLHNDLEQGALDAITDRLDDLIVRINLQTDDLEAKGYGEDLTSALRILEGLLGAMDTADALEPEVEETKKLAEENPRVDMKQRNKVKDVEYAYDVLKNSLISKVCSPSQIHDYSLSGNGNYSDFSVTFAC